MGCHDRFRACVLCAAWSVPSDPYWDCVFIGIASSIAMLVTKLVMLTLIPLSMAYNGIFNKIREFMLPDNHSFL